MPTDPRKRSVWPTIFTAVVLLSPGLYVASLGPLMWLLSRGYLSVEAWKAYGTGVSVAMEWLPEWAVDAIRAYLKLWR